MLKVLLSVLILMAPFCSWATYLEMDKDQDEGVEITKIRNTIHYFWREHGEEKVKIDNNFQNKLPISNDIDFQKALNTIKKSKHELAKQAKKNPKEFWHDLNTLIDYLKDHQDLVESQQINYVEFLSETVLLKFTFFKILSKK
jgi:hypothetical protein